MMYRNKTWVEISKNNLLHNVGQFLSLLGKDTNFMAVIKANAYGHGAEEIAKIIKSKSSKYWFGVDSINEAIAVRKVAENNPILILGYTRNDRIKDAVKNNIHLTIYNWETLKQIKKLKLSNRNSLNVHVKVETGTTRQGIEKSDVVRYTKALNRISGVKLVGLSTHFANIEEIDDISYSKLQIERYNAILRLLEDSGIEIPFKHMACSAAALLRPETYFNLARVGIAMYGLWPSPSAKKISKVSLKPVLEWKTIIAQVKFVKKGTPIGYDLTEHAKRDMRLAVLPVGYWDGYGRGLSSKGIVLINGVKCKVVGRVCMNMCMIDITHAGLVEAEDEVVLIGKQGSKEISAEDMATKLNTINYEIVTQINLKIERIIL